MTLTLRKGLALILALTWTIPRALSAAASPGAGDAEPPRLIYTDVVAGPARGGENDQGAYLSLFGMHFGREGLGKRVKVYIGRDEAGAYRYLGVSRGRNDIDQITVQVGQLRSAAAGDVLPIRIIVDGRISNIDHTFRVQPGNFLYVDNERGNDATAKLNDPMHPWQHVQTPDARGGALGAAHPGDFVILRGGDTPYSDLGRNERWFRFRFTTGSAPTGAQGTGYIAIVAYPGETVRYTPPPGSYGGIHGIDGVEYPGFSSWIVISGLVIEGGGRDVRDAPINLQARSNHWRIVNNEIGPWAAEDGSHGPEARAGGISGNGRDLRILGNHIRDIGGGALNHCIYLDTGSADVEIAYNQIEHCMGGNIIQTYDNLGSGDLSGISIHHNLMHDGNRFGLNIADGTRSARIWNNIVYSTRLASLRLHVERSAPADLIVEYNTFARPNLREGARQAAVLNDGTLRGRALIMNNLFIIDADSRTQSLFNNTTEDAIALRRNYWYVSNGLRQSAPDSDRPQRRGNPLKRPARAGDFQLLPAGPASGAAAGESVADDFSFRARPRSGASIGALQCCTQP